MFIFFNFLIRTVYLVVNDFDMFMRWRIKNKEVSPGLFLPWARWGPTEVQTTLDNITAERRKAWNKPYQTRPDQSDQRRLVDYIQMWADND